MTWRALCIHPSAWALRVPLRGEISGEAKPYRTGEDEWFRLLARCSVPGGGGGGGDGDEGGGRGGGDEGGSGGEYGEDVFEEEAGAGHGEDGGEEARDGGGGEAGDGGGTGGDGGGDEDGGGRDESEDRGRDRGGQESGGAGGYNEVETSGAVVRVYRVGDDSTMLATSSAASKPSPSFPAANVILQPSSAVSPGHPPHLASFVEVTRIYDADAACMAPPALSPGLGGGGTDVYGAVGRRGRRRRRRRWRLVGHRRLHRRRRHRGPGRRRAWGV